MGEFMEKYGGVIVTVLAITALVLIVRAVFTSDGEIGRAIREKVVGLKNLDVSGNAGN